MLSKTIKMSVQDWIKVEDNPIQRDTERHAAKAKHLLTPVATHGIVFAAELPSGKLVKLDGHTRAFLWKRGDVLPPMQLLTVNVIPVKDRAEAETLYKTFDNSVAMETLRDKVSGGFNRFNFNAQSPLLKAGSIGMALKIAYSILTNRSASYGASGGSGRPGKDGLRVDPFPDVYELIKEFQNELLALDAFGAEVTLQKATTALVAAFILTYRRHGRVVMPFWTGYFTGTGNKSYGKMDGIQAVIELMMQRKKGNYGGSAAAEQTARIVRGVEGWILDETFRGIPRPMDLMGYLAKHRRTNERLIKAEDVQREKAAVLSA